VRNSSDREKSLDPGRSNAIPEDELMREERVPLIAAALGKLSDEHRAILVLRELGQCDYATIASMLRVTIGTVRSRLHRARMHMRKLLEVAA